MNKETDDLHSRASFAKFSQFDSLKQTVGAAIKPVSHPTIQEELNIFSFYLKY